MLGELGIMKEMSYYYMSYVTRTYRSVAFTLLLYHARLLVVPNKSSVLFCFRVTCQCFPVLAEQVSS